MKRLLVLLALLLPAAAPAQTASTVKDAMESIEKTFSVYFVYNAGLPVDGPTTFRIDPEGNLQKNLRDLFADTGISCLYICAFIPFAARTAAVVSANLLDPFLLS